MLRLSQQKRAKGTIKSSAEDFRVEEIIQSGFPLEIGKTYSPEMLGLTNDPEGKFAIFVMQKTNWNTQQALKAIARKFRRGVKSTSFAGTKDRTSVSTQLCGIFGLKAEQLANIHIKDVSINGAWQGSEKIKMGALLGNRFGVTIRDVSDFEVIQNIISELDGIFPNYFGEQRFGNRNINVEIGLDILKGNFESAAMRFLADTQNETNEDAKAARDRLANDRDFKEALKYFPGYLKYELSMIEYLAKFPDNYANAIRKLPRSVSLMMIHSVEAAIFNKELEERAANKETKPRNGDLVCKAGTYGFPDISTVKTYEESEDADFVLGNILGYDTKSVTEGEERILEEFELTLESFKVQGLNELNSKGTFRALFAPFKDISYEHKENIFDLNFSLPSGSYATVLIDELVEK